MSLSVATGESAFEYESLWEALRARAASSGEITALLRLDHANDAGRTSTVSSNQGRAQSLTYSQLYYASTSLATKWSNQGVKAGDYVCMFLSNCSEYLIVMWATFRVGAVLVPLRVGLLHEIEELQHIFSLIRPSVFVVEDDSAASKLQLCGLVGESSLRVVLGLDGGEELPGWQCMDDLLQEEFSFAETPTPAHNSLSGEPALLIMSSGSTAKPKGCLHSYGSVASMAKSFVVARRIVEGQSRLLQHLPPFHAFAIANTIAFIISGGTIVLPTMKTFDAGSSVHAMLSAECTHMPAVPSMIHAMANHPDLPKYGLPAAKSVDVAGSYVSEELIAICRSRLGAQIASNSYGMTEAPAALLHEDSDLENIYLVEELDANANRLAATSGKPAPGLSIKICLPDSHQIVQRGEEGELHINGANAFSGYLGSDGGGDVYFDGDDLWIKSGDSAIMNDEGFVSISGRRKDIIICGGENISPAKVESCIEQLGEVSSSQVVGVKDDVAGEIPLAVIKPKMQLSSSNEKSELFNKIQQHVIRKQGRMVCPKKVLLLENDLDLADWPKTGTGKVDKRALRRSVEQYMSERSLMLDATSEISNNGFTFQGLRQIWSDLSGESAENIGVETSLYDYLDSIGLLRFCSLINRQYGIKLRPEDLESHQTIASQLELLSICQRESGTESRIAMIESPSSPTMNDAFFRGSNTRFQECRIAASSVLTKFGLTWSDVQQVCSVSGLCSLLLQPLRPRSSNQRHAISTPMTNSTDLIAVLKSCLTRHCMLRSMAVRMPDGEYMHLVMRPTTGWFDKVIQPGFVVDTPKDLKSMFLNDQERDFVEYPGPLFKALVVDVRSTNAAGLVWHGHHSVFDALSIGMLEQDLANALDPSSSSAPQWQDFKPFADALYLSQNNSETYEARQFHVGRLRGISRYRQSLWPPQRAPEWFRGNDHGWSHSDGRPGSPDQRVSLAGPTGNGAEGMTGEIQILGLAKLKSMHNISPAILCKAGCILFNAMRTGQRDVLFTQLESGRSWPKGGGLGPESRLPDPMAIAGPTFEVIICRTAVDWSHTAGQLLTSLQEEQAVLSRTCHVSILAIQAALRAEGSEGEEDADMIYDVFRRQGFNWLPETPVANSGVMVKMQTQSSPDLGLRWNFSRYAHNIIRLHVGYDDAQLYPDEVSGAIDDILLLISWLGDENNWNKPCSGVRSHSQVPVPNGDKSNGLNDMHVDPSVISDS